MKRNWIAVASAEHVRIGRAQGFMQVCHGKASPLRRLSPGDGVAYYSPTETLGDKDSLQAFTAIGIVAPGEPYQTDMGHGFCLYRRNVLWNLAMVAMPVRPLLSQLAFTRDNKRWLSTPVRAVRDHKRRYARYCGRDDGCFVRA